MKTRKYSLKPIQDQVIVVTGASSGIGLATAMMAAQEGARVVISSRNTQDLEMIARKINHGGGQAIAVTADVSKLEDMNFLRERALEAFGRIDTWVNNAAASSFGPVLSTPLEEARQIFETNFWGVHYGCLSAVDALWKEGGAIINIGSEVSERAVLDQTFYSASKHAVKAYTDGLRMELEKKNVPIALTLIRPAAIDTPFAQHAVNNLEQGEPSLPAPVYHPDVAARAILECACHAKRDVFVGGASKFFSLLETFMPSLTDTYMEAQGTEQQSQGQKVSHTLRNEGLMNAPLQEGQIRGGHKGHVAKSSLWTTMSLHRTASLMAVAGFGLAFFGGMRYLRGSTASTARTSEVDVLTMHDSDNVPTTEVYASTNEMVGDRPSVH